MTPLSISQIIGVVLVAASVSGCGGRGNLDGAASLATSNARTVDQAGLDAMGNEFDSLTKKMYMAPGQRYSVRDTGTATFNGLTMFKPTEEDFYINHDDVPEGGDHGPGAYGDGYSAPSLIANTAMTVDFGTSQVSTSMWNFHNGDGEVAGGSVQLNGTQDHINVDGTGTGTLDWGDSHETLDMDLSGYIVTGEYGIKATVDATSTIGGEMSDLHGRVYLVNDNQSN